MNVDYQVLTFKNKIKSKDIGGLGVELEQRKGRLEPNECCNIRKNMLG